MVVTSLHSGLDGCTERWREAKDGCEFDILESKVIVSHCFIDGSLVLSFASVRYSR